MHKLRPPQLFTQAKKYPAGNGGIFFIKRNRKEKENMKMKCSYIVPHNYGGAMERI